MIGILLLIFLVHNSYSVEVDIAEEFGLADTNADHKIDVTELFNYKYYYVDYDSKKDVEKQRITPYDKDADGKLNYEEFVISIYQNTKTGFDIIDTDKNGFLTKNELNDRLSEEETDEYFGTDGLDTNGDEQLSLEEFVFPDEDSYGEVLGNYEDYYTPDP